jgi:UDP-N-acetylglucosamine:LPS N-acetylglucosamine transferase
MNNNYIFFISGRSGGHLKPLLTVAKKINTTNNDNKIPFFICSSSSIEKTIINDESFRYEIINLNPLPKNLNSYITYPFSFIESFYKIYTLHSSFKPKEIYTTGGDLTVFFMYTLFIKYASIGSGYILFFKFITHYIYKKTKSTYYYIKKYFINCIILFIGINFYFITITQYFKSDKIPFKIYLYCLDGIPGYSLKLLSLYASQSKIVFKETQQFLYSSKNCTLIDYPLSFEKKNISCIERNTLKKNLNIPLDKKIVLVLGGSQGSTDIVLRVTDYIENNNTEKYFFIIQTGNNTHSKKTFPNVTYYNFIKNIQNYYEIADYAISRAGSGTLHELLHFNIPTYIIPLEGCAQNHQVINAELMEKINKNSMKYKIPLEQFL